MGECDGSCNDYECTNKESNMKKICIAAGGTGGHLFPANTVAKKLREKGHAVFFVGHRLQNNAYREKDFSFYDIASSPLKGNPFKVLYLLLKGFFQSFWILQKEKTDLIVSFGSYHTAPLLLAARVLCKPYILHDSNVTLGKVTLLFKKGAAFVATPFPGENQVEMPLKEDFYRDQPLSYEKYGLEESKRTILVLGGSQGAKMLNQLVDPLREILGDGYQFIHLTGKETCLEKGLYRKDFEASMAPLWRLADFAICRAGANTLFEAIYTETPALFIPYPYATEGHQKQNGRFMENVVKGGRVLLEEELSLPKVQNEIKTFFSEEQLEKMKKAIAEYKRTSAGEDFVEVIEKYE